MTELIVILTPLLRLVVVAFWIVFAAMFIDLLVGLYKSKLRGDKPRSDSLKRSAYKFVLYEGGLCIAALIDVCIYLCHGFQLFGVHVLHGVPVVSFLLAIFFCVVEGMSVREKADEKIHSELSRAERLAKHILTREEWMDLLAAAMTKAQENNDKVRPNHWGGERKEKENESD